MNTDKAIKIVAKQVIEDVVKNYIYSAWEDFPDIGEGDWDKVAELAIDLSKNDKDFAKAYKLLEERAMGVA